MAAITCTFGNLAAYGQTNIKRLLAYSTIAHAGYMMMPVAAGWCWPATNPVAARSGFRRLAVLRRRLFVHESRGVCHRGAFCAMRCGSEEIADYAGLMRNSPGTGHRAWALILFSLVGMPPLAGFVGKLVIFSSLVDAISVNAAAE